jgi:hypothetical protein
MASHDPAQSGPVMNIHSEKFEQLETVLFICKAGGTKQFQTSLTC